MVTRTIGTQGPEALELVSRVLATHSALLGERGSVGVTLTVALPDADSADVLARMMDSTLAQCPRRMAVTFGPAQRSWTNPLEIEPTLPPGTVPVKSLDPASQRFILNTMIAETPLDGPQCQVLLSTLFNRMVQEAAKGRAQG